MCIAAAMPGCSGALSEDVEGISEQELIDVNNELEDEFAIHGFTGNIESSLRVRLGRQLNPALVNLGRLLWFDKLGGLHNDNTCAGCHSPTNAFADTQSIAIGVQNNNIVGPNRAGPRNQRRSPTVINSAFFPRLMWNGRFFAPSGDPFNNSQGFTFPPPEGTTAFPPNDPIVKHLLIAQAHIPFTELVEMAGFTGTAGTISPEFDQFDDGFGSPVPPPDASGFRNEPIRQAVLVRLNATPAYRQLFGQIFSSVAAGGPIDFKMVGQAIGEFTFSLTFANAPIDRFARGDRQAMTTAQKRGALIFFREGRCIQCHAVSGGANEMFSDFNNRVIGVPQIAPRFGVGQGNVIFDGPGRDEDFGLEQITGSSADRYKFRTSPLRNVGLQPSFFHNGAFTRLRDAVVHHLDVRKSARGYSATLAGIDVDLRARLGPIEPVLARLDPILDTPIVLDSRDIDDLVDFVGNALTDARAAAAQLCQLRPLTVPSGLGVLQFEGCP
jgi:cytochrome c peroxidase